MMQADPADTPLRQAPALTPSQNNALQRAIYEYLRASGLAQTAATLAAEAQLDPPKTPDAAGTLETKWANYLVVQKRLLDAETRCRKLELDLERSGPRAARETRDAPIPKAPAKATLQGHRSAVTAVAAHPTCAAVATASEDGTVKVWDGETGQLERTLRGHEKGVNAIAFQRGEGRLLASASSDGTVKLWSTQSDYTCVRTLRGHDEAVSAVAFAADGRVFSAGRDHTVRVWSADSGFCSATLVGHTDWVRTLALHASDGLLASGGADHTVRLWDVTPGRAPTAARTCHGHSHVVEAVAFAPAAAVEQCRRLPSAAAAPVGARGIVASAARDMAVRLWDAASGQCLAILTGHDGWVRGVTFTAAGQHVVSVADDRAVRVWDLSAAGACVRTIPDAHHGAVTSIVQSPVLPALFVTGGSDATARLWF